jgi:hypothetical protein
VFTDVNEMVEVDDGDDSKYFHQGPIRKRDQPEQRGRHGEVMPSTLNFDQHRLTREKIKQLTLHRETRELLERVAQGSTPVIAHKTRNNHLQIRIVGDGIINTGGTPQDIRAVKNLEAQIRRGMKSIGHDFPRKKG